MIKVVKIAFCVKSTRTKIFYYQQSYLRFFNSLFDISCFHIKMLFPFAFKDELSYIIIFWNKNFF